MARFFQIIITFFLAFSLIGCKKEKTDVGSVPPAWFLYSNQWAFTGKISDSSVLWKYGVFEFQGGGEALNIGSIGQPLKYLTFWLTANVPLTTRFEINKINTNFIFYQLK